MANYSSRFIEDYATICEPLRMLTRHKDVAWQWDDACEKAFITLKKKLSSDTVMSYYNPEKPVEVRVDASPVGLGAILMQEKIVSYASRSLTPVESRYSQVEREALAVVWACEHFDTYLRGLYHFNIITDHKPLEKIWQKSTLPSLRIERWGLRLQPYKFSIRYEPGESNMADYMSRHPVSRNTHSSQQEVAEAYVNFVTSESLPRAIRLDDVREATSNSPTFQKAIEFVRYGQWHELKHINEENVDMEELAAIRNVRDELTVHSDNVLLCGHRIVLPHALRNQAINIAHEGHQGMAKTKAFLRSKVWFPNIDSLVEDAVKDCIACQMLTPEPRTMEPLRMSELPAGPWENISIDFCGPLPSGEYIFVMIDEYSRYPIVEIVRSVSANATIPVLDKVLSMFGTPRVVKSDNGSPFNSDAFHKYAENMGFDHRRITPHWPRANAQAESLNKPIMKIVRAAHLENKNWKQELFKFLRSYRATPHCTTGFAPHRLMFSRDPKTKLPVPQVLSTCPTDQQVREKDSHRKYKMKEKANVRNRACQREISVGDTVLMQRDTRGNKISAPFYPEKKTVLEKKGPMVTVTGNVTRNVSRFKRIRSGIKDISSSISSEEEVDEILWPESSASVKQPVLEDSRSLEIVIPVQNQIAIQPRRSNRDRRPNVKYSKDYVC